MNVTRTQIAAGGTVTALGVLAAFAIGAGTSKPTAAPAALKPAPVEVRTVVVHRTVKVVRHQKPKKVKPASAPPAPARSAPVQIAQAPAAVQVSQPAPAKTYSKPLTTKSSGGASGGGERENESGDSGEHEGGGDD